MPKNFKGENSKATAARERKAAVAAEEKAKKDQAKEDALWVDDDKRVNKKQQRQDDRDKKRQSQLDKKAELRSLSKMEEETSSPIKPSAPQKVTRYEVQKAKEMAEQQAIKDREASEAQKTHLDEPLIENLNRLNEDVVSASGIDSALEALSTTDGESDKGMSGRKMAQAFRAFEDKRLPQVRKEYPNMRMSQWKQMIRKEWLKSPENPLNQ